MPAADTITTITDERVRCRILDAIARHLGRETGHLDAYDVVSNGDGVWMVSAEAETLIAWGLRGPVTRLVEHSGIGTIAESWRSGFLVTMSLVSGSDVAETEKARPKVPSQTTNRVIYPATSRQKASTRAFHSSGTPGMAGGPPPRAGSIQKLKSKVG